MRKHSGRLLKHLLFLLALFAAGGFCAGCGAAKKVETGKPAPEQLRLAPGDTIEIKFPYAAEFNEIQTLRPDGNIVMPLVGEIRAAGKTPAELQSQLIRLHKDHLQHPELAVIVRTLFNRKVYVSGQVNEPGLVEMPGRMSVLEAINEAGGFDMVTAKTSSVVLVRYNNGKPVGHKLDLEDAIKGKDFEPVYLEPKDVVFVPQTNIVKVGQWVSQHIYDLLPPGIGFGVTYDLED